jgi:hypothetical protein
MALSAVSLIFGVSLDHGPGNHELFEQVLRSANTGNRKHAYARNYE